MTENKLSEKEMQGIREEAEELYPDVDSYGLTFAKRKSYIAAITRERERVKGLVSTLEEIATFYSVGHPVREMIETSLSNYQKTKEQ